MSEFIFGSFADFWEAVMEKRRGGGKDKARGGDVKTQQDKKRLREVEWVEEGGGGGRTQTDRQINPVKKLMK